MTPESFSRSLAQPRSVGVSTRGCQITINDVERLRGFCEPDWAMLPYG